jgi:hypothetical protein
MYKKPITQKAKSSPFKEDGVEAVKTQEGDTRQVKEKREVTVEGNSPTVDQATGGKQAGSAGDYLKGLSNSSKFKGVSGAELANKGYISDAYINQWNDMTNYTPPTATKVEEVTTTVKDPDTKSTFTPQIEDKTDRIGTVGDYRNNLMVNRSINRDKNLEKRQQRDLAREYARQSDGRNGLFGNWRERRNFMKGNVSNEDIVNTFDALNEKTGGMSGTGADKLAQYQQNYATMRGLTADQQTLSKSGGVDRSLAQYEQGGNKEISQFRNFENKDFGTERGTMTKNNIEKNTGFTVQPGNVTTNETSPGSTTTTSTSNETASPANNGAAGVPTTNKVNGTGSSSKASTQIRMKPSFETPQIGGANVPKVDLSAAGAGVKSSGVASVPDAGAGGAASGESAPRKNWKDRLQNTVDNARTKRAERQNINAVEAGAKQEYKDNKKEQRMRERGQVDKDGNIITRKQMRQNRKAGEAAYQADQDFQAAVNQVAANANKYETNLESVSEAPDNTTFDASYRPENKVAKAGMEYEGTKLETVPEAPDNVQFTGTQILADRKAKAKAQATALEQANSMKANTGTANRSSYNRTSAPLVDGTPTRENRPPMSPAQMRFEQNVGIKQRSPMKKGYFKGK